MSVKRVLCEADKEELQSFETTSQRLEKECEGYLSDTCHQDPLRMVLEPQVSRTQNLLRDKVIPISSHMFSTAPLYDFCSRTAVSTATVGNAHNSLESNTSTSYESTEEDVPHSSIRANGLRSILKLFHISCENLTRHLHLHNDSVGHPFRRLSRTSPSDTVIEKLQAELNCHYQLTQCLILLHRTTKLIQSHEKTLTSREDNSVQEEPSNLGLFPSVQTVRDHVLEYEAIVEELLTIQKEPFYGHCVAFHMSPDLRLLFKRFHCAMAGFLDMQQKGLSSLCLLAPYALSYFMNPEKRAITLVDYTHRLNINQVREFWQLADAPLVLLNNRLRSPAVAIAKDVVLTWSPDGIVFSNDVHIKPPVPKWMPAKAVSHQPTPLTAEELNELSQQGSLPEDENSERWLSAARVRIISGRKYNTMRWLLERSFTRDFIPFSVNKSNSIHSSILSSSAATDMTSVQTSIEVKNPSQKMRASTTSKSAGGLLFHCHGGGFIANSPRSHEMYLRPWTNSLHVPIVSVDYSHAPLFPYPNALEECFYSYCWTVRHATSHLGVRADVGADNIVLVGDSAGASLLLGVVQRIIQQRQQHAKSTEQKPNSDVSPVCESVLPLPSALVLFYPPCMLASMPSPSRMLTLMDPLLPMGIVSRCLLVYRGMDEESELREYRANRIKSVACHTRDLQHLKDNDLYLPSPPSEEICALDSMRAIQKVLPPIDPLLTPLLMEEDVIKEFPPVYILVGEMDPLLDDGVELAKLFQRSGKEVHLHVLKGLPHGFLNLNQLIVECRQAFKESTNILKKIFQKKTTQSN